MNRVVSLTTAALLLTGACLAWPRLVAALEAPPGPTAGAARHPGVEVDPASFVRPAAGASKTRIQPTTEKAPDSTEGAFRTACTVSHMSFDDPIVFPGKVDQSHSHTFFGNTLTSASSTPLSIRTSGNSTCRGGIANRSAYWVPTMIDTRTHRAIAPDDIGVYYKNGYFKGNLVKPIPEGLRMIAGNPGAKVPRDPWGEFSHRFKCAGGPNNENDKYGSEIPNCDVGAAIVQEVFFPQCWDGQNLDSPDHKSHMAFTKTVFGARDAKGNLPQSQVCPPTHPVILPQISFNVVYTVPSKDAPLHWRLASDTYDDKLPGGYSSHGDWFNGWDAEVSDAWAKNCIEALKDCHSHLLGDGRMIF
jgi:hypothetical protein